MQELTVLTLETAQAVDVFNGKRDTLQDLLNAIKSEFDGQVFDVTTPKGRKECASAAHKIARSKTALDSMGKEAKSQYAKITSAIDADRRLAWDTLEALQNEIRRPLDEWESAEKSRIADIQSRIAQLNHDTTGLNAAQIADKLAIISAVEIDGTFAEFQTEAAKAKGDAFIVLSAQYTLTAQAEKEAAEAEAKRIADAEAKRQQEIKDAAEKARLEAEAKAQREAKEREEAHQRDLEAAKQREIQAEAKRIAAENQARIDNENAEKRRIEAEQKAERDRIAAAEKAEQDRLQAIETERLRVAAEAKRIADEQAKREADVAHRKEVNNAALNALVAVCGIDEATARKVVSAIVIGQIPAVKINY